MHYLSIRKLTGWPIFYENAQKQTQGLLLKLSTTPLPPLQRQHLHQSLYAFN